MRPSTPIAFDYGTFFADVKTRIASARLTAARAVNSELVGLYWDIGSAIREKQTVQGWGDGVVERLSSDLKRAFPGTTGFSAINLWRLRQLHETYTAQDFLSQVVRINGHDPYAYLRDVLERLPTQPASRIEELLPHRWQTA